MRGRIQLYTGVFHLVPNVVHIKANSQQFLVLVSLGQNTLFISFLTSNQIMSNGNIMNSFEFNIFDAEWNIDLDLATV